MTLNITVTTPKCIYQCADFQLTNANTDEPIKGDYQKQFLVHTFNWSATVNFSGIARNQKNRCRKMACR